MSARDLGAESTDDLSMTPDTPERTVPSDEITGTPTSTEPDIKEISQQSVALGCTLPEHHHRAGGRS